MLISEATTAVLAVNKSTRIPNTFPQDQCLAPNLISLRDLN
jgi:hypothetical protein